MVLPPWRYVTFDATGTLLRPVESPSVTYLRFWESTSTQIFSSSQRAATSNALISHFPTEFRRQSLLRPNFGAKDSRTTAFPWWRELILNVMLRANIDCLSHSAQQSERFTRELYAYFAQPEAWTVFADVRPTLDRLLAQNIPMGVISNFDERLEPLLVQLQLRKYFAVVTTSFAELEMKPHAKIFQSTFRKMQNEDEEFDTKLFLHVGDNFAKDFKGAKAVGANAKLLWRSAKIAPDVKNELITTLKQVTKEI